MHRSIQVLPAGESETIAHDSVKRLLERQPHHTEALYNEAKRLIRQKAGVLVIDNSTFDNLISSDRTRNPTLEWKTPPGRQGINLISTV